MLDIRAVTPCDARSACRRSETRGRLGVVHRLVLALSFVMGLLGGARSRVESEAEQIAERAHDCDPECHERDKLRGVARHDASRLRGTAAWVTVASPSARVLLQTHRTDAVRWAIPRRSLPDGNDDDDERMG